MKIAILTTFRIMPDSYALVHDVIDQVKILKRYGHEVVFFAQIECEGTGIDCEIRAVLPHFKLEKNVENKELKEEMKKLFEKELKDFDVVITHDLMYLQSYYTHRLAIIESNLPNVRWIHWCHSGVGDKLELKMPRSKYIYMNYKDVDRFAKQIGVGINDVRVVFNDKDPRLFFNWNSITNMIADKVNLFDRDIIQTFPLCSTRMNTKGIDNVIKLFGKLKSLDNKVLLIICNANARKKQEEINQKIEYAKSQGLTEDEIIFTSTISKELERGVPRQTVKDLMQISNLFIFPSITEVCPNTVLEASMTKQLVVLNKDCPAIFDFAEDNKTCLGYNFGSLTVPGFKYRTEEGYLNIAKEINQHLLFNKANQQFLKILKLCSIDTIYKKQIEPILYESY